ncbi:MAG: IclR family transcriptional regulator C-terminal domain-containing protein [Alphaproteobacteria bacterium]
MQQERAAPERSGDFVGSLARGLAVIQAFGADASRMTLTEVAERTGLTRAAARRFLLTLHQLGFVAYDGKFFALTPKVLSLGFSYLSSLDFWEATRPYLEDVTHALNESCSAAVLDGADVVYVARSAARHRIMSVVLRIGSRLPAHATSMGQVLLGALGEREWQAYCAKAQLSRFTSRTLTDPAALLQRVRATREHGYALVDQELEEGLRSIAVPICDGRGAPMAAINISTQAARVSKSAMLRDFLPRLRTAAARIGAPSPEASACAAAPRVSIPARDGGCRRARRVPASRGRRRATDAGRQARLR